jgi:predicted transcriptional regulator of viral defense system
VPVAHAYEAVHELALGQHGVFTAEQATKMGVNPKSLVAMAARGRRLERIAFGLYRDLGAPETRWTEYMKAALWPQGVVGVLSHDTALGLMNLSDANPALIHVTIPAQHRVRRRKPPPGVVLHRANLPDTDVGSIEGIPVTKAARTIRDCAAMNIGPALIRQAIEDATRDGWLTPTEADALRSEFEESDVL